MDYTLDNKKVIITGANSGIGKAAAILFAKAGATVIIACRSEERGLKALAEVKEITRHDAIELLPVDMSSQASIKHFAEEYRKNYDRLDVLIHNAANFDLTMKKPILTTDGIETIFATNHIGVFLLTHLLLDNMKASRPARIITVASKGLMTYPFLDIEFDNLNGEKRFSPQHAYYHSKLAQVIYTYELARRLEGTGITVNCVQVGNVALADDRLGNIPSWLRKIYSVKKKFAITPEKQAETYLFLGADPSVSGINGGYWDEHNRRVRSIRSSYNQQTWKQLWDQSTILAQIGTNE